MVVIGLRAVALNALGGCQFATYLFSGSASADAKQIRWELGGVWELEVGSWELEVELAS